MKGIALALAVIAGGAFYAHEAPCQAFCRGNSCFDHSVCGAGCYCAKIKTEIRGVCASLSQAPR